MHLIIYLKQNHLKETIELSTKSYAELVMQLKTVVFFLFIFFWKKKSKSFFF